MGNRAGSSPVVRTKPTKDPLQEGGPFVTVMIEALYARCMELNARKIGCVVSSEKLWLGS